MTVKSRPGEPQGVLADDAVLTPVDSSEKGGPRTDEERRRVEADVAAAKRDVGVVH